MPSRKSDAWPEGTYVLLANNYQHTYFDDSGNPIDYDDFERGEEIELDAKSAFRLGSAGAIAKSDHVDARIAKGELSPAALDLNQDENVLEAQMEAIKAKLDELKNHESERAELKAQGLPHVNVQSMKLPDRAEAYKAVAESNNEEGQVEAKAKSKGSSKSDK